MTNLRVDVDGRVALVTLDRPPVNAVDQDMYREISDVFAHAGTRMSGADVVIVTGAGKNFCGGNDLAEFMTMTPENVVARMAVVHEAFRAIYECDVPVIAAVDGVAVGTGLAIVGSCDLVVASDRSRFGLPEISVGAMGGAKHLSRLAPQGLVRKMFYTADLLAAQELAIHGGIAKVVPAGGLLDAAHRLAASILNHSSVAIRIAKKSLNAVEYMDLQAGYAREQEYTGELSGHPDSKEAVQAFFEKRRPRYSSL